MLAFLDPKKISGKARLMPVFDYLTLLSAFDLLGDRLCAAGSVSTYVAIALNPVLHNNMQLVPHLPDARYGV